MNVKLITLVGLIALVVAQSCDVTTELRSDCGFMGINQQQCEAKGCCWKPARLLTE